MVFATSRLDPAVHQKADLVFAVNKTGPTQSLPGLEAAFGRVFANDPPQRNWIGHPLEKLRAEILEVELPAEQLSRAVGDDNRVRLGKALETGRNVRRLADDHLLLGRTFAQRLADQHETRGDAHSDLESHLGRQHQPADHIDDR